MTLADAHIHLFPNGYRRPGAPSLFGDGELRAYKSLRVAHDIELALAIGYEAGGIDPANNAFLRRSAASLRWLRTLAFVETPAPKPEAVASLIEAGHVGLAIYALEGRDAELVLAWPRRCWDILRSGKAIVSFNSRPEAIAILETLIIEWPQIPVLFSHLGLPGVIAPRTPPQAVIDRLRPLLRLARHPNVHVKISGVYATSAPEHAYPHSPARYGIRRLLEAFGPARCLWASDFAPALEFVSFPQTIEWPGSADLTKGERRMVFRDNLVRLLCDR